MCRYGRCKSVSCTFIGLDTSTQRCFAIAEQTGFENQWLLFSTYLDAVAAECADLTVPAWTGRLAAVDIWTYDHCWQVAESLRID